MIELGSQVKDKVTGFIGIATAHARNITGCDTIYIQPVIDKDGKLSDGQWFDVNRLAVIQVPSQTGISRTRPIADANSVG